MQNIKLPEGKTLIIQQTCTHPDYPDTGNPVRIDFWRASLVCPENGSTKVIEFSNFKVNGEIPAQAVNLFIGSYICMSFKILAEKLIEYRDQGKVNEEVGDVVKGVKGLKV